MIRINLLPVREARRQANLRLQGISLGAAAGAAVVLALGIHLTMGARVDSQRNLIRQKQAELAKLEETQKEVRRFQAEKEEIERKLAVITQIEKARSGPVKLMDEIATRIPQRVWITDLKAANGVLSVTGNSLDAEIVAEFLTELEESPIISKVELLETTLREVDGLKLNHFKVKSAYPTVDYVLAEPAAGAANRRK